MHKGSSPFRNKGWPWFATVQRLMPSAAHGANAFHALQLVPIDAHKDDSNANDEEEHPYSDWVRCVPSNHISSFNVL